MAETIDNKFDEKNKKEGATFPTNKILTVSATEYVSSVGKDLSKYTMQGVHVKYFDHDMHDTLGDFIEVFAQQVPLNAEVIVNYETKISLGMSRSYTGYAQTASGTALIPKNVD